MVDVNVVHSVSKVESILGMLDEREDQLYALSIAILDQLTPKDEKNLTSDHPITAWRLAQVLEDMLSSATLRRYARESLLPAVNPIN